MRTQKRVRRACLRPAAACRCGHILRLSALSMLFLPITSLHRRRRSSSSHSRSPAAAALNAARRPPHAHAAAGARRVRRQQRVQRLLRRPVGHVWRLLRPLWPRLRARTAQHRHLKGVRRPLRPGPGRRRPHAGLWRAVARQGVRPRRRARRARVRLRRWRCAPIVFWKGGRRRLCAATATRKPPTERLRSHPH